MLAARAGGVLRSTASPRGPGHLLHARCKTSTGIVGLPVQPEAKAILEGLYTKTLSALERTSLMRPARVPLEAFPASAEYAKVVGGIAKERLAVVKSAASLPEIEAKIGAGQVEQLIEQAEDELKLLPVMLEERVWEAYQGAPAEDLYLDLKRRGIASPTPTDFPTTEAVELIEAAEPEK